MNALRPDPRFLAAVRSRIAQAPPARPVTRPFKSRLYGAIHRFGNPFTLLASLVVPSFIVHLDGGQSVFGWSVLLFLGIAQLASVFHAHLQQHPHLVPFSFLPVETSRVLRRQANGILTRLAGLSIGAGIGFGIAAHTLQPDAPLHIPLASGLLMAVAFPTLAAAYILAAQRSAWLATPLSFALPVTVLLLIGFKSSTWVQTRIGTLLETRGDLCAAFLPTGWIVLPWHSLTTQSNWAALAALVPLAIAAASIPYNLRWTARSFEFREAILLGLFLEPPEDADEELAESVAIAQQRPSSRGETAITDDILERRFLVPSLAEPPGRIEELVWKWWTPRERIVAEYLRLYWPEWSSRWRLGAILLAITIPASVLLGILLPDWMPVSFIGFAAAALYIFPVTGSFTLRPSVLADSAIQQCPIHTLPVTLAETGRLLWKATAIRSLAALPISSVSAALALGFQGEGYLMGAAIGAQAALIWTAIRPGITVYRFQTLQRGWMPGFYSKLLLGFLALVLILDIAGVLLCAIPLVGFLAIAILAPLNHLAFVLTCRCLDRRRVDALKPVDTP